MNIRITTAASLLRMLWPRFELKDGGVVLEGTNTPQLGDFATLTEAEAFYSHTHMTDVFVHRMRYEYDESLEGERPDPTDPKHVLSWEVARQIGTMWLQKLSLDFPHDRFRVYVTRYDEPLVRFHKVREHEQLWLEDPPVDVEDPGYVVFDTARVERDKCLTGG